MQILKQNRVLLPRVQHRNFYSFLYRLIVKKDDFGDKINVPEGTEIDRSEPKNINEAKDKYVADKLRDMLYNMKETKTPKGVWFSTFVMSVPLIGATGYLAALTPVVGHAHLVDANSYAYMARTCVRLLSLNISFFGGIHYGLASATYDTARTPEEERAVNI